MATAQLATLRTATGSLFGVVSNTAGAVSSLFVAATDGISMLDNYVKHSLNQQQLRIVADNIDFETRLTEEKATEMTTRGIQVLDFCNQSEAHKTLYASNFNRITAALEARKATQS